MYTGLFQHALACVAGIAKRTVIAPTKCPGPAGGLCSGQARRAVAVRRADRPGFAAFVQHAGRHDTKRFRNFSWGFDRRWLEDPGARKDSHGRALWALVSVCNAAGHNSGAQRWAMGPVCRGTGVRRVLSYPRSRGVLRCSGWTPIALPLRKTLSQALRSLLAGRLIADFWLRSRPGTGLGSKRSSRTTMHAAPGLDRHRTRPLGHPLTSAPVCEPCAGS